MEITASYLRKLGFRRKRRMKNTEYLLDVPATYGDWITIAIARVQGNWVTRKIKAGGEVSRKLLSEHMTNTTVEDVIAFAEFYRYGKSSEANAA